MLRRIACASALTLLITCCSNTRPPSTTGSPDTTIGSPDTTIGSPDTTTIGSPDTTSPPPPPGLNWKFHAKTERGWEYDVTVTSSATWTFTKDVSSSPPGKARLVVSSAGEYGFEAVPTIPGRNAPKLNDREVGTLFPTAVFVVPEELRFTGVERGDLSKLCGFSPVPGVPVGCRLLALGVSAPSQDWNEGLLDQWIAALSSGPAEYVIPTQPGGCTFDLVPGKAARMYYQSVPDGSCQVTDVSGPGPSTTVGSTGQQTPVPDSAYQPSDRSCLFFPFQVLQKKTRAFGCVLNSLDPQGSLEITVPPDVRRFSTTLYLGENSRPPDAAVNFRVLVDGFEFLTGAVTLANPYPIDVPLTGASTITVSFDLLTVGFSLPGRPDPTLVGVALHDAIFET